MSKIVVLHSCALLAPAAGIAQQMRWEQAAAEELGLDWRTRIFCPPSSLPRSELVVHARGMSSAVGSVAKLLNWIRLRYHYYRWLKSLEDSVDLFLLRYYVHDPFQLLFLRTTKKAAVLVHHSLEVPELASAADPTAVLRSSLERLVGKYAVRASALTVGVTPEIARHQIDRARQPNRKWLVYPNGVRYEAPVLPDQRGENPELLFTASAFLPWHGLDLLLAAVKASNRQFVLHLVGELRPEDRASASKDPRIVIHGRLTADEIRKLSATAWIGLSSFALHRNNMEEACTLKVREYLMMGLPVYSGHRDVFDATFPFYKTGNVVVDSILEFAQSCRSIARETVSTLARPSIDKVELLRGLYEGLLSEAFPSAPRGLSGIPASTSQDAG
jgi:glycosyltransferase involved in cell wall biosynthesis